jgi:alkylation response protein AidB-like acyl-CoA dehydrogenase
MDFSYSPEEEKFRQEVRAWIDANVPDELRGGKDEDLEPDERWQRGLNWHKKLHEGGWIGLWWPKEYGGRGASMLEQAIWRRNESLGCVAGGESEWDFALGTDPDALGDRGAKAALFAEDLTR